MNRNRLLLPGSSDLMERAGAGEDYEHLYKKTGKQAKKDWDGDGKIEPDPEEYAGVKDKKIKQAMGEYEENEDKDKDEDEDEDEDEDQKPKSKKHRKSKKEESFSYSDWRDELSEELDTPPDPALLDPAVDDSSIVNPQNKNQVKENSRIRNKVVIGPSIQENLKKLQRGHLSIVLEFAVDHFADLGCSGRDIVEIMEEVGSVGVYEYLLYSMDDGLYESHVNKRRFSPMYLNVIEDALTDAVMNVGFEEWINQIIYEGYDLSEYTINDLRKIYVNEQFLVEKSVSQSQQKLFGLALGVKRGEVSRDEVSKEVLDIVDKMSTAEIRKFAKTKRSGLPETKGK